MVQERPMTSAGLLAHDRRKDALVAWAEDWRAPLSPDIPFGCNRATADAIMVAWQTP